MTPNDGELRPWFGKPKIGVLNALNASARNWSESFSAILKFLNREKSRLRVPGPRTSGSVRPTLPNVNGGGWENTDVLKYRFIRSSTGPERAALWPLLFGRSRLFPEFDVFDVVSASGMPFCSV